MKQLAVLFVGIAVTLTVFLMHTRMQVREVREENARLEQLIDELSKPNLVADMGRIQVYMEKLWHAGDAGNAELAEFYRHEIEEVLEDLAAAKIEKDGHDITLRIEQMVLPVLEAWEERGMRLESAFEGDYMGLVNACNSCHQVTDHAYIRIQKPERVQTTNQTFTLPE